MRERVAIMLLIVGILLLFAGIEATRILDGIVLVTTGFACMMGAIACMLDGDDHA
jgi:hypothetical protein